MIKNIELNSCRNCIYHKPYSLGEYTSHLSGCEKFGKKNVVTDKITYDFADLCRSDENKCGIEGKYFEEEENINLKITKHSMVKIIPWFFIIFLGINYIYYG